MYLLPAWKLFEVSGLVWLIYSPGHRAWHVDLLMKCVLYEQANRLEGGLGGRWKHFFCFLHAQGRREGVCAGCQHVHAFVCEGWVAVVVVSHAR